MSPTDLPVVVWITFKVALAATAVSVLPGVALGWWLARRTSPWHTAVEALVTMPMVLPPVAVGLALLTMLSWMERHLGVDLVFTWQAAALAGGVMGFPLLVRSVQQAIASVPPALEQVATTLGASPWAVFHTVTLPLSRRGIAYGMLLAFARSVGEFGATMLVAGIIPGSTETLATGIYRRIIDNQPEAAGILALLAALLAFASIAVARRLLTMADPD